MNLETSNAYENEKLDTILIQLNACQIFTTIDKQYLDGFQDLA